MLNQALNVFPTEIWEMIIQWIFEMDCWEDEFNSEKVCQAIGLPFKPMIARMMNQFLPKIRIHALQKISNDFNYDDFVKFQAPTYIVFYSLLGRFLKRIQFQLPSGYIDSILTEFISKQKKSGWQELHLAHRRLEVLNYSLDMQAQNFLLIQEWIQFIYMFLFANILPCKCFMMMNYHAHCSLRKQLGSRFHRRNEIDLKESSDDEAEDLWRSDYL